MLGALNLISCDEPHQNLCIHVAYAPVPKASVNSAWTLSPYPPFLVFSVQPHTLSMKATAGKKLIWLLMQVTHTGV